MTSKPALVVTAKSLILLSVLSLAACDGGIFGTGGSETLMSESPDSSGLSTDNMSQPSLETTTDVASTAGDTDTTDTGTIDAAVDTVGAPESDTGTSDSDNDDVTTGDTMVTDVVNPTVDTDGDTDTTDTTSSAIIESSLSVGDIGTFINNRPALRGQDAQMVVVNTSALTVNIVSPGTEPDTVLFEITDVAPNTTSEYTVLGANITSLTIVDSNNADQVLVSYSPFIAELSTLTTLLIREDDIGINVVALVTETLTDDSGLAKVRIVQGGTLGNTSLESQLQLQSAGDNPGGVDTNFGPISFDRPQSDYKEVPAGDYELVDLANRISPFPVSLSGNTVYTLLLTGNGMNEVRIITDSEAPQLNQ